MPDFIKEIIFNVSFETQKVIGRMVKEIMDAAISTIY
jgi:hypothetical protein